MPTRRGRCGQLPPAAELYPEDGVDPRQLFGDPDRGSRKKVAKTMQLCRQVERALSLALADERAEPALAGAIPVAVEPAPNAGRLLVRVHVPPAGSSAIPEANAALSRCHARLRREVARSVHRKRAPELVFEVRLAEASDE